MEKHECIEAFQDVEFRKSSFSVDMACVEVATVNGYIGVRDSKDPNRRVLVFDNAEWGAFVKGVIAGEFSY